MKTPRGHVGILVLVLVTGITFAATVAPSTVECVAMPTPSRLGQHDQPLDLGFLSVDVSELISQPVCSRPSNADEYVENIHERHVTVSLFAE